MKHPDLIYTVQVDYATGYPIIPDERTRWVRLLAATDAEAREVACLMVYGRRGVLMPTRATILNAIA